MNTTSQPDNLVEPQSNRTPESAFAALLKALTPHGSWRERARCAQSDPDEWFPEKGGSTRRAKAICAGCPVAAECLQSALDNHERFGIWGGLSERELHQILLEEAS